MKVMHIVGARPNFMKVAPIMAEMARYPDHFQQILVHTGQHYDFNMSDVFFQELGMRNPDEFLGIGSGSHAEQTARVMMAFEPVLLKYQPDWVIVVGDVNSTLACALVCAKLGIRVAHVEAGLRSGDQTMPEEINRIVTDQLADALFTPSRDADENLQQEGIALNKIYFVGNVMVDTLAKMLPQIYNRNTLAVYGIKVNSYVLVTLHRPSNVDNPDNLKSICEGLAEISSHYPVIFPVHPRTRQRIADFEVILECPNIKLLEPQGYLDFLALTVSARLVLTDSGGVQEETTYLGIPCLTLRPNTERPVTITSGTNQLVENSATSIIHAFFKQVGKTKSSLPKPELWDGCTAQRIVSNFLNKLSNL